MSLKTQVSPPFFFESTKNGGIFNEKEWFFKITISMKNTMQQGFKTKMGNDNMCIYIGISKHREIFILSKKINY